LGEGRKKAVVETYHQDGISRDRHEVDLANVIACLKQQAGQ